MPQKLVVRAIDVGYGHVKWSDGRDETGEILADRFPSQAPLAVSNEVKAGFAHQRDTCIVPVNGRNYEVGRAVRMMLGKNQELEQLDEKFALSDGYTARVYGALNYMLPTLPARSIDFLVLGLPLTTLNKYSDDLSDRFLGEHIINTKGDTVVVSSCAVYPQPLGAYAAYLQRPIARHTKPPMALIIDVGYNTVDWLTCEGLVINPNKSDAVERGMSGYLREVAKSLIKSVDTAASESELVRLLDRHLIEGSPFLLTGKPINLDPHWAAGDAILEQAAQSVRNNVGAGLEIDIIIVSGGGASIYAPWVQQQFRTHDVIALPQSTLANVRGFQHMGEAMAESARRARPVAGVSASVVA